MSAIMCNAAAGELMHHQFIWPSVGAVHVTPPHVVVVMVMAIKILQPSPTDKI